VITTKWVAYDVNAGAAMLAELVGAPFAATCPNFRRSRHPGLRAYEDGHVKEGAGAGGSMAAAHLTAGASESEIVESVDKTYDELVLGIR
jgi:NaMN:DMB phosphoribosyltransferase